MKALIASCIDPIVQIDTLGTILLVNLACCDIFQYEEDELLGKNIAMLMPEPYASQHAKYMKFYMDTGKKKIMAQKRRGRKLLGLKKDATTFPMFLSLSEARIRADEAENSASFTADKCRVPGETESGEFTTIFTGIMRDLSAEEEERQVMEAMINSSADPIVAIDIHGKIERANPACTAVFGFEIEDMMGRNVTMLMPEHHACQHHVYLERYLSKNPKEAASVSHVVGKGRDVTGKRKDGTAIPILLSVSQFNLPSSKKQGFVGIMRDMTEKERAVAAEVERQKSEVLLMNVLPRAISDRLKGGQNHEHVQIADHYENVTILFADVVGFTKFAADRSPMVVVHHLNRVFSRFDSLVGKYGLEKIKTIGDAYMVVSGLDNDKEHIQTMLKFALDILEEIKEFNKEQTKEGGHQFGIRIGLHAGSVVAGVVGTTRRFFDLWGDAVNVASRMESGGIPNCVQCTEIIANEAKKHTDLFAVVDRGVVDVKGKGTIEVFLVGPTGGTPAMSSKLNEHKRLCRRESIELHGKLTQELRQRGTTLMRAVGSIPSNEPRLRFGGVPTFVSGLIAGVALTVVYCRHSSKP